MTGTALLLQTLILPLINVLNIYFCYIGADIKDISMLIYILASLTGMTSGQIELHKQQYI